MLFWAVINICMEIGTPLRSVKMILIEDSKRVDMGYSRSIIKKYEDVAEKLFRISNSQSGIMSKAKRIFNFKPNPLTSALQQELAGNLAYLIFSRFIHNELIDKNFKERLDFFLNEGKGLSIEQRKEYYDFLIKFENILLKNAFGGKKSFTK
ncbi:hypothetical protein TUBRATIS_009710 [Tubulinosema ratisbonensis]|uniref:Uncharacterized protein n=1 Tax=Tubulinosema ratisbonensis TaxID=291195 RepID=A0A437AN35_9MICR|nr:hypothetical protein TUBRATIS_009710 [Tubulinosema ratisbonensis]